MSLPEHPLYVLVWAPHEGRTETFARWLEAPLFNVHYLLARRPWVAPLKYPFQWLRTWYVLFRGRPRYVFVTNPPPVAALAVLIYCRLTGNQFVMDTHPPSLHDRRWGWAQPVTRFISRFALVNLTDQQRYKDLFESWGARTLVLENPPKNIPLTSLTPAAADQRPSLVYVGTLGEDEPVDIVIEAAREFPEVDFFILGDKKLAKRAWIDSAPPNVTFTGYLTGTDYWNRLYQACGVIVLTTYRYSLLGGGMDGLYLERPLLLSDQPTTREYFTKGAVLIENTAAGMGAGIRTLFEDHARYEREIAELRADVEARWHTNFAELRQLLQPTAGDPA